jgi:hypothetical protein
MEGADQREWRFANYDVMIDTPTEIAPDWTEDRFEVDGKKYLVMVHSFGDEGGKRSGLVRDIEKIVRAETAMWGPPEFDAYTFLIHFAADDHSGDGMEHLTSTQIIEPGALADDGVYADTLDTVAHEFFHVWNVKRLRPVELGPWDYTRPVSTRALWIAEGFTNYYGHLMKRRAQLWDDTAFLRRESQTITGIENAPGSRLMSAEASSLSAPFIDDAPHAQQTNLANTSISYYPKGELIALVLDLMIRGKSNGKTSLDDVMRRMYQEFYLKSPNASYYLRGRGYSTEDFQRVASEVSGIDLDGFFMFPQAMAGGAAGTGGLVPAFKATDLLIVHATGQLNNSRSHFDAQRYMEVGKPVDPALVLGLIRQESSFDTVIVSPAGARGLMQLMPGTAGVVARKLGVAVSLPALTIDAGYNMRLGTSYLRDMLDQFDGAVPLAVAAYNAGPNRVQEWLAENGDPRTPGAIDIIDWMELIPFSETRNYVQLVGKRLEASKPAAAPAAATPPEAKREPAGPPGPSSIQEIVAADGTVRYVSQ